MAHMYSDHAAKQDPVTAKVRPMFAKTSSDMSAPPNSYANAQGAGSPGKPGGINLFAYKPPPSTTSRPDIMGLNRPNVTVLPSGNIKYTQSRYMHPPPPYSTSIQEGSASGYPMRANHDLSAHTGMPERSITVDIEALRRKFAHAPRPLKKRSSITEPERPQGPMIPKLLYDQLYKKADTPFYRTPSELRSTPPPAYIDPPKPPAPPLPQKPSKVEKEDSSEPSDAISYESNVTPTEFLKQQKLLRAQSKAKEVVVEETQAPEEQEETKNDNESDCSEKSESSDDSYDFPPPPMPSLSLVPEKGILK